MTTSFIPEKPILVYPSLAQTLGLDEAVMLSALSEMTQYMPAKVTNSYAWYTLSLDTILSMLSFWGRRDLHRVTVSLREKGVIIVASAPLLTEDHLKFAFNEKASAQVQASTPASTVSSPTPVAQNSGPGHSHTPPAPQVFRAATSNGHDDTPNFLSKNYIANNWQADQTTLEQLAQHNIPAQFAHQQVPEFVTYWRERGEAHRSWGAKFIQHTLRQWRIYQEREHKKNQEVSMHPGWQPSIDTMELLTLHAAINREFIEDAIPEFILYWQERGDKLKTWNSKFIQHVRLQWKKYNSALEHSTDPKLIADNWQPSHDVYDVLRLANIDLNFAQQLIPEFVLYWKDSNQLHTSWNTRYLQHVKRQWANRHAHSMTGTHNANPQHQSTRDMSLEQQLTDRSWAN